MKQELHVTAIEAPPTCWLKKRDCYLLQIATKVCVSYTQDGKKYKVIFKFKPDYKCDGLSVPKIFQWFLPSWDDNNKIYNWAGIIHDALYGNKGFDVFTREQCDSIFRGILRISGISRFKAGCADKALEWFACLHWGDDNLKCSKLVTMEKV